MCTVSVILNHGMVSFTPEEWSPVKFAQFKQLVEAARAFDIATGQPDCPDPNKELWYKTVAGQVGDTDVTV